jgi:hypothetical protein
MVADLIPSLIMQAFDELRARGVLITNHGGEWRVRCRGEGEESGYFTDDLQDALERGRSMVVPEPPSPLAPKTPEAPRRKWRRPMNAKAMRRRRIRAHNHRMRGRALKERRDSG